MNFIVAHWLPGKMNDDGTRQASTPCPDLLTAEEAVRLLRLDEHGTKDPIRSLQGYREQGLLKGVRIGTRIAYRRTVLIEFIESDEVEV